MIACRVESPASSVQLGEFLELLHSFEMGLVVLAEGTLCWKECTGSGVLLCLGDQKGDMSNFLLWAHLGFGKLSQELLGLWR